ncbi:putative methyltransferase B0303.2 [Aphelenchoides fujianensis]|nr:putative methyltransferase B0303.2 [Aphelenchoides fujianensis]
MPQSVTIFKPEDYEDHFDGAAYLEHFYSDRAMESGTRLSLFALPNFAEHVRKMIPESERRTLLDVGSGPTVYSAICFRRIVKQIYLSDFVPSNLELLEDWVEQRRPFDWTAVSKIIGRNEGLRVDAAELQRMEEETRAAVKAGGILHANVHNEEVLRENPTINADVHFDVLVSIFCLESACSTHEQYARAIRNMLKLLRPGGCLILGSVIEDNVYVSGMHADKPRLFTLLSLKEEFIVEQLEENGIKTASMTRLGLVQHGALFLMARKKEAEEGGA